LSLGFAFNDNFQISTRYDGFLYQNFNLRPKYRFLNIGNWEEQITASAGFHIHSNWLLRNFHTLQEGVKSNCSDSSNPSTCQYQDKYVPVTQTDNPSEYDYYDNDEFMPMIEFFAAASYAKTRNDLNGRYQFTLGTSSKVIDGHNSFRTYVGFDIDLNNRLKLLTKVIYDPYLDGDFLSTDLPFENIYIDLGAIYTTNNNLSFGVHMLPYFVSVYWKQ